MKNKKTFITQTTQHRSLASLSKAGKDLSKKLEEDNIDLLLSILDSLNKLYEKLDRLNYEIQRRSIEHIFHQKGKE
jgi:hypothetical protein